MIERRVLLPLALLLALAGEARAWPAEVMTGLGRDARRLLPRSLSRLLGEREPQIQDEMRRFPRELGLALATDLPTGRLSPETLEGLTAEADRVVELLRAGRVSEGLVRMGALLRVPADLSDPVLGVGPQGWPPGLTREYYALLGANLAKMPVVLESDRALHLARQDLPAYWQGLAERSRPQVSVIRAELYQNGRVVDHRRLDYRSPAWAVASLSYSRAVTGIAATWLALWREAHGDTTRMPAPRAVAPRPPPIADERPAQPPEAP